jgi:cation diffusion facilitator CzcD-associated flavoprotein CzcO
MTDTALRTETSPADAEEIFDAWFGRFTTALEGSDVEALTSLIVAEGWWRDLLALTWNLTTRRGTTAIASMLSDAFASTSVTKLAIDRELLPHVQNNWIQGFFYFETPIALGRGVARLVPTDEGEWAAWTVLTALEDLKGHERSLGSRRPVHPNDEATATAGENWLDRRRAKVDFKTAEPDVVIVGAGQGGLALAANLGLLGVDTLVLERNERVGDSWRKRYRSLVLHDPVWADHLPYLPFPRSWPVYSAKDKIADWLEFYASSMELNVWTSTQLLASEFDEATSSWTLRVQTEDGERVVRPRHVVLATGAAGEPNIPEIAGISDFQGEYYHSSRHQSGSQWKGRKAVVVGACNSGHDIARDLYESGADVTLVQRSSTYIMSQKNGIPEIFGGLFFEGGLPTEYADLLSSAFPWPVVQDFAVGQTKAIAEMDHELLARLEAVGFKLNDGPNGGGLMTYALRNGGGYYIDVGCSELIADRKIALAQGSGVSGFTPHGIELEDGRILEADLVVLATGYSNMRETARRLFGDTIADRCEPVLGVGEDHELGALWKETGQEGFWFMGGPLAWVRIYSKYLAMQIKGELVGLRQRD